MILDTLTKTIEIVLGEATATTECDVTASWGEHAVDVFLPGGAGMTTNGVTPVTVVDAPVAAVTQRLVQEITLHNNDTIDHTVTLSLNDTGTLRIFRRVLVKAGGDFAYAPSVGVSQAADAASYFSIIPGTPKDTLQLEAPTPDHLFLKSATVIGQASGVVNMSSGDSDTLTGEAYILSGNNTGTGGSGDVGAGSGSVANGTSGYAYLWTGNSAAGGSSGDVYAYSGDTVAGNSGIVHINSGNAPANTSGAVEIHTGPGDSSGGVNVSSGDTTGANSGSIAIYTGAAPTVGSVSGDADIYSSDGASSGGVSLGSGNASNGSTGPAGIYTGPATGGTSGYVYLITGNSDNSAGAIQITTGDSSSGDGGDVIITLGTGAGRNGLVYLMNPPTVDPVLTGALWVDPVTHIVKRSP